MRIFLLIILFPIASIAQQQDFSQVRIAGHRGGYYFDFPESSLSLFGYIAKQFGRDTIMVELDLRKSKNGTIYIMHDETIERTTDGKGKLIDLEDSYLNTLFLKKESGEITHERIPTFEEILRFIHKKNINLMLDIKIPIHADAYELVKKYGMENRMLTLTFNMDLTKNVAKLSDKIFLSALIENESDWDEFNKVELVTNKKIGYINTKTPKELIQKLKINKIKVMADVSEAIRFSGKPLDDQGYQKKVKDNTLDILITDFPIEASKSLHKL
jgi:glycerophosphoryl diester phosphodiesterase